MGGDPARFDRCCHRAFELQGFLGGGSGQCTARPTDASSSRRLAEHFVFASESRPTVRGEIPYRNAVWYVLASAGLDQGRTANAYIGARTFVKSYAKTCKHVAYATIVFWAQDRECAKLDRAISQIDNEYLGAVNGRAPSGRPLLGAFDGFVPASHSVYPSTVPVQTFTAQGANHNNLTYALAGVAELDRALVAVGVKRIQ